MKLGFTGTRRGMQPAQRRAVFTAIVERVPILEFHHGDCIGADAEANECALMAGAAVYQHPSTARTRAYSPGATWMAEPKAPTERDRDIVDSVELLIAAPRMFIEELRSGTWTTIRYARKKRVPLLIVWPDGTSTLSPPRNS